MDNSGNIKSMIRQAFILVFVLSIFNGNITAQCVDAGTPITAICQGVTTGILNGSFVGEAASAIWSDGGAGGTFFNNDGNDPASTTYSSSPNSVLTVTLTLTASGGACQDAISMKTLTVNPNPTVDAGPPPDAIIFGATTGDLDGTFGGGAISAIWSDGGAGGSFSDNTGSTPATARYTSAAVSISPVTLTLTTSGGLCGVTSASKLLYVGGFPVASNTMILGEARSGMTLYASYLYLDAEGDAEGNSLYQWYMGTSSDGNGSVPIGLATNKTYKLTDFELGSYIGFSVIPVALNGATHGIADTSKVWIGPVINDPPIASAIGIKGLLNVYSGLTGQYVYSDFEGDLESGSSYQWLSGSSLAGPYTQIDNDTSITHVITLSEQGRYFKFVVTPKAGSGSGTGIAYTSSGYGPANTKPGAANVTISGFASVDSTLTGHYDFFDTDGTTEGASRFRWLRNQTVPITGATDITYLLVAEDEGYKITFEVTPVSMSGYPDTGDPESAETNDFVTDLSPYIPVASKVCISGIRAEGEKLEGKYIYTFGDNKDRRKEGESTYRWLRGSSELSDKDTYTLTQGDIDSGEDIIFEVTPYSSHRTPKVGIPVQSNPLARIDLSRDSYSLADPPVILKANVMGGIFSGPGVTNGTFYPSTAGSTDSPHTLLYNISSYTTCTQEARATVNVLPITTTFYSFKDVYCFDNGEDTIYVSGVPATATSMLFRLSDPAGIVRVLPDNKSIIIDPGMMNPGINLDTLFFSYIDGGSIFPISRPFIIDKVAPASINNLNPGDAFCNNGPLYQLFPSHQDGVFSGPVTDDFLDPTMEVGLTSVGFMYTNPQTGCSSSITVPIVINKAPVVAFSPVDYCIENGSDTTRFINATTSADSINNWLWEFVDAGRSYPINKENPGYLYKTGGLKEVTVTATTVNDCSASKKMTIDLGVKPVADFYWIKECYLSNDSLMLFDKTFAPSPVVSQSWGIVNGDEFSTKMNTGYMKQDTGYLNIQHIVYTSYANCSDTIAKHIFIRPTISLKSDNPYDQKFETGKGGWVVAEEAGNSWVFGKPDGQIINTAASGERSWFTSSYLINGKFDTSSVVSPCFDFREIERPMIRLKLRTWFDRNRDGAVLQYKGDDLGAWQQVGTIDDGINWFNSPSIKGKPGGTGFGWTTIDLRDSLWKESYHTLDELKGMEDVKFRIAYGSDGNSDDNEGIAFDDIWIGERRRNVLLEHFTNTLDLDNREATAMVNTIVMNKAEDVINIQYHTNFPGSDPFYDSNPGDASARILYYGLIKTPYSFIDGGTRKNFANIFDYNQMSIDSNDVKKRSLISPRFDISLNTSVSGGVLSLDGQITALDNINTKNLTLYLAVTEKENRDTVGENGEDVFYNVFRKFIPDAGGLNLKTNWTIGESMPIAEKSWVIENIKNSADIEVIAFIQDNISKELYQAFSDTIQNIVVGIEKLFHGNGGDFALYPNPAVKKFTIAFEEPLTRDTDVRIYDIQGTVVASYKAGSGLSEFVIEDKVLRNGIYLVRVSVGGVDMGFRKLIISGN